MRLGHRTRTLVIALVCLLGVGACGVMPDHFANQLVGSDGRPILLEEVVAIVDDGDLDDEQKREALRGLGIADEELIDALLTL